MGKSGPAPTPTRLKLLRGNPGRRPLPDAEPVAPSGVITRPPWLSELAAEEWGRVLPLLEAMGTISPADITVLAVYCEAVARWRGLAQVVASSPPVIRREGILVKNPAYSQIRDAAIEVRLLAREFGLTPSARAGIRVEHHHTLDGAGRLLSPG